MSLNTLGQSHTHGSMEEKYERQYNKRKIQIGFMKGMMKDLPVNMKKKKTPFGAYDEI